MAERTGTITQVTRPEKGPIKAKLLTDEEKEQTISVWARIPQGDDWIDNPLASQFKEGDYGTFSGEFKDWKTSAGEPRKSFEASGFVPKTRMNGSASHAPDSSPVLTSRPQENRDASFALSYAKDICVALVEAQHLTVDDVKGIWFSLADEASQWLRQQNS